ncbi:MAG: ser/thr kinase [Monoraphidium minutum]|nr:MAG: ser/thr kinase [Monoraphidium minutum]
MASSRYQYVRDLGEGSFGKVVLATDRGTGEQVAIKKLMRQHLDTRMLEAEVINHSSLFHPHVIRFREVFVSPNNFNIVMDYANGGSLFSYVRTKGHLSEDFARWCFQQMVLGLDYCHKKGVANRDLKLENTLLDWPHPNLPKPIIKICDFGYSKHDSRSARTQVGTYCYMSPEVLRNAHRARYDAKLADIWSCGVALYVMLVGRYPFGLPHNGRLPAEELQAMLSRMEGRGYDLPPALGVSKGCAALLARLLDPDPGARITMEGLLQDPWFSTDLPPTALALNQRYLGASRPSSQSEEQICVTVQAAATRPDDQGLLDA